MQITDFYPGDVVIVNGVVRLNGIAAARLRVRAVAAMMLSSLSPCTSRQRS